MCFIQALRGVESRFFQQAMQDQNLQRPGTTSLSASKPHQLDVLRTVQVGHKHDMEKTEGDAQRSKLSQSMRDLAWEPSQNMLTELQ